MPDPSDFTTAGNARSPFFVGIDVGGTNIKIGLVDDLGRTLAYLAVPTEQEKGAEDAARRMGEGTRQVIRQAGVARSDVVYAGLATPGPMDIPNGMLLDPGNLQAWHNTPIRDRVSRACGLPVRYANDANAAAYGEYWAGAGKEIHSMVLLTLGTGIGGGIITNDVLVEGAHSCGSECGHILIDLGDDARLDSMNHTGSLEAYCGAYGVVGRCEDALAAGRKSILKAENSQAADLSAPEKITPLAIAKAAEAGDEFALEIIMETARYMALGIVSLIHTIDPDCVVLAGAMTYGGAGHPLGERYLQRIRDEVRPRIFVSLQDQVTIGFARLGGDAGYIGAAGLARKEFGVRNAECGM